MSQRTGSRKHVTAQALDYCPTPNEGEKVVRVVSIRGSNILEVEYPTGERVLSLMPARFNKTIWVKRGNYVIVEPFKEQFKTKEAQASKLKARIVTILLNDQVKNLRKTEYWPPEFNESAEQPSKDESDEEDDKREDSDGEDESDEELDEYLINPNHRVVVDSDESESDDSDDSEEEEETDEEGEDSTSKNN